MTRESQTCMQLSVVADPVPPLPPDAHISTLLRHLDDLVTEAERLRKEIQRAMARESQLPFWPERRHRHVPVPVDRRHHVREG